MILVQYFSRAEEIPRYFNLLDHLELISVTYSHGSYIAFYRDSK